MSYAKQATTYRDMEVLSASPERLVVLLYEQLLVSLQRVRLAIETNDVEMRCKHLDRSRSIITELLTTLDHERGGAIASQLSALYAFLLAELIEAGRSPDVGRIGRIIGIASELRDAFSQAASASAPRAAVPA